MLSSHMHTLVPRVRLSGGPGELPGTRQPGDPTVHQPDIKPATPSPEVEPQPKRPEVEPARPGSPEVPGTDPSPARPDIHQPEIEPIPQPEIQQPPGTSPDVGSPGGDTPIGMPE